MRPNRATFSVTQPGLAVPDGDPATLVTATAAMFVLIVRPEGRLFFVNVQYAAEQINALAAQFKPGVGVLNLSRVPDIEYSALQIWLGVDLSTGVFRSTFVLAPALLPRAFRRILEVDSTGA